MPSFGFVTALYATSAPLLIAFAKLLTVISFSSLKTEQIPFKICDKMTPELPLAPLKAPFCTASHKLSKLLFGQAFNSLTALFKVKLIFVPVSPSGTGKTFKLST